MQTAAVPNSNYNRRNVPIWALPTLDKIISYNYKIINFIHYYKGTKDSCIYIKVEIPNEGLYLGHIFKRDPLSLNLKSYED